MIPDDLIDSTEAAQVLRLHVNTLHRWRLKGKVRAWKRGRRWFFSRAELLACFTEQGRRVERPRPAPAWVQAVLVEQGLLVAR